MESKTGPARAFRWAAGALALVFLAGLGSSAAAADGRDLYRPQADVARDPAAFYSPALYQKMGEPKPGDWMAAHPEPAQNFQEYVRSVPNRPTRARHTLVLVPVGPLDEKARGRLKVLADFLGVYYTLPVRTEAGADLAGVKSRERTWGAKKWTQYLTGDVLQKVLRPRVKADAFCVLGVTMEDLYPEESWNYVFGQASLAGRVGVYSLVRFYPAFWGEAETPEADEKGLRRSLQTLVHETGHMFGVNHCQAYECVMNGSNSLAESDARPIHLCPECLKKFRWNTGFGVVELYRALDEFYGKQDMKDEAAWVEKRIGECGGAPAEP